MADLLVPIAISSEIDDTGVERVHAAKFTPTERTIYTPTPLPIVTWSPTDKDFYPALSEGNLLVTGTNLFQSVWATLSRSSGKYQFEGTLGTASSRNLLGIQDTAQTPPSASQLNVHTLGTTQMDNSICYNNSASSGSVEWCFAGVTGADTTLPDVAVAGDIVTIAVDMDSDTFEVYLNGNQQYTGSIPTGLTWIPAASVRDTLSIVGSYRLNAGATPLQFPVPGYLAWNGSTP